MRTFDLAIEFEGGLIVVLNPDRRAEIDAEVEAIIGCKEQRGADWYNARSDFVAIDFQNHFEGTGWPALDICRLDLDLQLAGRQFVLGFDVSALNLEQIVFIRQHALLDVQREATGKTPSA